MRRVFRKHGPEWSLGNWMAGILSVSFLLCLSPSSEAGMVYGRVFGGEGAFQPGDKFTLIDSGGGTKEVTTDGDRGYSIIIPEGAYRVEFRREGRVWEGWIESFRNSIRQDINLKPAGARK